MPICLCIVSGCFSARAVQWSTQQRPDGPKAKNIYYLTLCRKHWSTLILEKKDPKSSANTWGPPCPRELLLLRPPLSTLDLEYCSYSQQLPTSLTAPGHCPSPCAGGVHIPTLHPQELSLELLWAPYSYILQYNLEQVIQLLPCSMLPSIR